MGVLLDLEAGTAEVPEDKVQRTVQALEQARKEQWIGVDTIQSLLGLMGFCAQVLMPGGWRTCWTVIALNKDRGTPRVCANEWVLAGRD